MKTGQASAVLLRGGNCRTGLTNGLAVSFQDAYIQGLEVTRVVGKRKREETKLCSSNIHESDSAPASDSRLTTKSGNFTEHEEGTTGSYASVEELWPLFYSAVGTQYMDHSKMEQVGKLCILKDIESEGTIKAFQQWIKCQNLSPIIDCALVIVKFNVFRALLHNGQKLGFSTAREYLDDDALSPFVNPMRPEESLPSLPPALRPTDYQSQIPHHPWLDLLPEPVMRDNLIRAEGVYDQEQLCADIIGLFGAGKGRSGLIIRGEPWDPSGWEVTKPFLKHWGWALRGCNELLRATNYWRGKRGELSLRFERVSRNWVT
jgi:hypothetical protein